MSVKSPAKLNFKSSLSRINKKYIIPATRSDATYVVENLDRFNIPLIDSSAIDSSRGIIIEKPFPKSPAKSPRKITITRKSPVKATPKKIIEKAITKSPAKAVAKKSPPKVISKKSPPKSPPKAIPKKSPPKAISKKSPQKAKKRPSPKKTKPSPKPKSILKTPGSPSSQRRVKFSPKRDVKKIPIIRKKLEVDEREDLPFRGFETFRVGAVGDGSCFIHSLLYSLNPSRREFYKTAPNKTYQSYTANYPQKARKIFAKEVRKWLTAEFSDEQDIFDGKTWYQSYDNGIFADLDGQEEFSEEGIRKQLAGCDYFDDNIIGLAAAIIGIDVIIVQIGEDGQLKAVQMTDSEKVTDGEIVPEEVIVIFLNNEHFESVGLRRGKNKKEIFSFSPDDDFIKALRER